MKLKGAEVPVEPALAIMARIQDLSGRSRKYQ